MFQEYIEELTYLLTLAKNSRTKKLLEEALESAGTFQGDSETKQEPVNGTTTSSETVKVSSAKPATKGATKISQYGTSTCGNSK